MNMMVRAIDGEMLALVPKPMPKLLREPYCWYLLRVHPGREFKVMAGFDRRGFAGYLATFSKRMIDHRRCGITRMIDRPLFPGLIFVPDYEADIDRLRLVEGVTSFLHFGVDQPPPALSPKLFEDVRRLEAVLAVPRSKRARMWDFHEGDQVRISEGPFAGWTARFDGLDDHGRIRVLIDAMKRGLTVKLSESQVEPV